MKEESIKIYSKKLNDIEKELTNIFNEVMSGKIPLKRRIELRKESLRISIDLLKVLKECIVLSKKELRRDKIVNYFDVAVAVGLTVGSVAMFFFNPLISLVLIIFAIIKSVTKLNSLKNEINESKNITDEAMHKFAAVATLMDNIDRRLSLDINVNFNKDSEIETKKIDLANDVILEYLETGNLKEVEEDIELYVMKLLLSDLKNEEFNKEECNMESLLKIAKEKIDKESKEQGIKLIKGE